jgi:hypothetical protein
MPGLQGIRLPSLAAGVATTDGVAALVFGHQHFVRLFGNESVK